MDSSISDYQGFVKDFLSLYLERGFGSLNKREIDILMMHLLIKYSSISSKSNHELSLQFLLSPTKIKNLRYEAKLKYLKKNDYFTKELLNLLKYVKLKKQDNNLWIMFSVEDELLKQYIQAKIKEIGSFTDSSFNSEIVKIELRDFVYLIDTVIDPSQKIKITNTINAIADTKKSVFEEVLIEFFKGIANGSGSEIGKFGIQFSTGGISSVLDLISLLKLK